ncbi:MAG: transketolase [Gammaproteobacteria bacterium]|nr:transketolase [Gammaproteobacteria bacterium]
MPSLQTLSNSLRFLSIDAVQKAKSGHPGAPMGMAEMAVALWHLHLKHNPQNPHWANRDRFILSNGHASMLLYSLLHLTGYSISMEDLKSFRQWGSITPGHPEVGLTPGVETTTGPLGQGLANAVGMALAEKILAKEFNRPHFPIIDHYTYLFVGDGCLMEGISHEVCSLAGSWKLNKLIVLYDANQISIDGRVDLWFTDDTKQRFLAYRWQVLEVANGHDIEALSEAIQVAKMSPIRPTLIICHTLIGKGSPNRQNTAKAHGEPLGDAEVALTRRELNWPHQAFEIPPDIYQLWDKKTLGQEQEQQWDQLFTGYQQVYPQLAEQFLRRKRSQLPSHWQTLVEALVEEFEATKPTQASRKSSALVLEKLIPHLPELLGGGADLTPSTLTQASTAASLATTPEGDFTQLPRYIHYGVREFGMVAIMNGLALYKGFIPFGGTFLTFSDYARNAIRMAALMHLPAIYVFTHDSIGLGEDGPTHQPIEHIASLRLIPNLSVWRPADATETAVAWGMALQSSKQPTALILSRQNLPHLTKSTSTSDLIAQIQRGGYIVSEPSLPVKVVLMASGSEVGLASLVQKHLAQHQVGVRVVSMPNPTFFATQPQSYQQEVLGKAMLRIALEAGVEATWWQFAVRQVIGISQYGASAPADKLFLEFGLSVDHVANTILELLHRE